MSGVLNTAEAFWSDSFRSAFVTAIRNKRIIIIYNNNNNYYYY